MGQIKRIRLHMLIFFKKMEASPSSYADDFAIHKFRKNLVDLYLME